MTTLVLVFGLSRVLLASAQLSAPSYYENSNKNALVSDQPITKLQVAQRDNALTENAVTPCPYRRLLTWTVKAPVQEKWALINNWPSENSVTEIPVEIEDVQKDEVKNVELKKVTETPTDSLYDIQKALDCFKMQTRRSNLADENKDLSEEMIQKFLTVYNTNKELDKTRRFMSDSNSNKQNIATYEPINSNDDNVFRRLNYRSKGLYSNNINVNHPKQSQLSAVEVNQYPLYARTQNIQPIEVIHNTPSAQDVLTKEEKKIESNEQAKSVVTNVPTEEENRLSTKEIEEKLMEPTRGANIFPLKASDMMKMESSRVCYACSSISDVSCLEPNRRTTVKYCKRGHNVCVTKVYKSNDQDQIIIRDCSESCEKDVPVLNTRFKTCSVCTSDLCNNKLVENGARANTQSLIYITFVVCAIKYCVI